MSGDIIFVSYPSGGFGNFVFHVLTHHFKNTHKVSKNDFNFSPDGNSHSTTKYLPDWFHDPDEYILDFESNRKLVLLVDNGITNDGYTKLRARFNHGTIVRLNISDNVRPVVYKTMAVKAQRSDPVKETLANVKSNWDDNYDWNIRENFTLLYKNWPFAWNPIIATDLVNVSIEDLIRNPLDTFRTLAVALDDEIVEHEELDKLILEWKKKNQKYFDILTTWKDLEHALDTNCPYSLPELDLHDQGYLNYCIERKFNVIIPVYDYRNWFTNSIEIQEMIECLK
jgi:hypothetical protein